MHTAPAAHQSADHHVLLQRASTAESGTVRRHTVTVLNKVQSKGVARVAACYRECYVSRSRCSSTQHLLCIATFHARAAAQAHPLLQPCLPQVVTTQMQARANLKRQLAAQGQSGAAGAIRSDAMGVVGSIWQEDGLLGFWKGEGGEASSRGCAGEDAELSCCQLAAGCSRASLSFVAAGMHRLAVPFADFAVSCDMWPACCACCSYTSCTWGCLAACGVALRTCLLCCCCRPQVLHPT